MFFHKGIDNNVSLLSIFITLQEVSNFKTYWESAAEQPHEPDSKQRAGKLGYLS
jgi:hypothetical protein